MTHNARRVNPQDPVASASEGGVSATVKKASTKLLDAVGGLLGMAGSGGGKTKTKAKKSSKSSKKGSRASGGGGFTEAFEAKHGKR